MQSLKLVIINLQKESRSDIFFNFFLAAPQPSLGYYRGDNPHQTDFDPKFTGGFVTRLTCFKSPLVLQVKILENTVITIRSMRLFLWKRPKVGLGQPNNSLKDPSRVPSGV